MHKAGCIYIVHIDLYIYFNIFFLAGDDKVLTVTKAVYYDNFLIVLKKGVLKKKSHKSAA